MPIGFAQCTLRNDYVEGSSSSPVGYLEGIYVKDEYRGDIRYNLDKEHPEYQLLLTKERTTEGPYITNIGFRETPMGIGGSYAQGQFMDSLYLVDYRNRCYKRTRKSEGLYYHRYLLMYEYKPFKLTKENAEIIAKSIYLSK